MRSRYVKAWRRFARAERGATAVEFALIAMPFFALLFGTLQMGLLFMNSTTIESAAMTAARQVRTGQLQTTGNNTSQGFKDLICGDANVKIWLTQADCEQNLSIDVRTFGNFASITSTLPVKNGAIDPAQLQFNSGTNCSIVMVRAFYPYTLFAPTFTPGLPDLGSNQKLITVATAFRNENWGTTPC